MNPATQPRPAAQWYLLGVLTFSYLIAFVDRGALQLLVQPIRADLQISDVQMSLLLGLGLTLLGSLLMVPAGWLVDRVDRRLLMAASIVAWSAMTMACGFAGSFAALLLGRAGVGISEAGITPTCFSLLRNVFPPARRGRAFAVFSLAPAVAIGLSLLLGGTILALATRGSLSALPLLAGRRGWQAVLLSYGALGVLPLALMLTLREPQRIGPASSGFYGAALAHLRLQWRLYLPLAGFAACNAMLAFSIGAWLPAMIGRIWHLSPPQIGLRFGVLLLVAVPLGAVLTGIAIDRRASGIGPALVGLVTSTTTGVLVVIVPFCGSIDTASPLIALLAATYGAFYPVGAALLARITPDALMGRIAALYLLVQNLLGQALAPTLVALAGEHLFSGPRAIGEGLALCGGLFAALGLLCLAATIAALRRHPAAMMAEGAQ